MEPFETFDRAASVFARRRLGQRHFRELYAPVEKPLARAYAKRKRSADAMLDELAQPSRADRYETWGHLLMAQASGEGAGRDEIALPDIMGDASQTVTIPLDPALSAVENAERYYDKARRTRRSREEAESRWEEAHAEAEAMGSLLARLRATTTLPDLRDLLEQEDAALGRFLRPEARGETTEPFRRFPLPGGYEALVGKHARGNAHLTTRVASPHDLWLHARGVPGSHVVIKKPSRDAVVPPEAVGQAARLAARFSEARTQTPGPSAGHGAEVRAARQRRPAGPRPRGPRGGPPRGACHDVVSDARGLWRRWSPRRRRAYPAAQRSAVAMNLLDRITTDPAICHGQPTIRGLRYPVSMVLDLMSGGMTSEEILADYEDLEVDDLRATLAYAARLAHVYSTERIAA